jgi:hypothetical protein
MDVSVMMNREFCPHKFTIKDSLEQRFCHLCGRKKGDYIHELEQEIIELRKRLDERT